MEVDGLHYKYEGMSWRRGRTHSFHLYDGCERGTPSVSLSLQGKYCFWLHVVLATLLVCNCSDHIQNT